MQYLAPSTPPYADWRPTHCDWRRAAAHLPPTRDDRATDTPAYSRLVATKTCRPGITRGAVAARHTVPSPGSADTPHLRAGATILNSVTSKASTVTACGWTWGTPVGESGKRNPPETVADGNSWSGCRGSVRPNQDARDAWPVRAVARMNDRPRAGFSITIAPPSGRPSSSTTTPDT
jgi:hypothetical protein